MKYTQIRPGAPVKSKVVTDEGKFTHIELKLFWAEVDDIFNDVYNYFVTEDFKSKWEAKDLKGLSFAKVDTALMDESGEVVKRQFHYLVISNRQQDSDLFIGEDKEMYGSVSAIELIKALKCRDIDFGPDPMQETREKMQKKINREMYFDEKTNSLRWRDESKNI